VLEALDLAARISGNAVAHSYEEENRVGDHLWWIGSNERFQSRYAGWEIEYGVERILGEIHGHGVERWVA
jgi:CDP-paratose 2-epimerase